MKDINGISILKINYLETSRGVAYVANLLMDKIDVGAIENKGDGGSTIIHVMSQYQIEFNKRMKKYFDENNTENYSDSYLEELFADNLIDVFEYGKVLTEEEKLKMIFE